MMDETVRMKFFFSQKNWNENCCLKNIHSTKKAIMFFRKEKHASFTI